MVGDGRAELFFCKYPYMSKNKNKTRCTLTDDNDDDDNFTPGNIRVHWAGGREGGGVNLSCYMYRQFSSNVCNNLSAK